MKRTILAIASLGLLAAFAACSRETTEVSSTTSSYSTQPDGTVTTATVTTATVQTDSTAPDGGKQIADGAKMVGRGIKEEARQAVAAGGEAMEEAGQAMQEKAEDAKPPNTTPSAPPPAPVVATGNVASGASTFNAKCSPCHGADAGGNTAIGRKNGIPDLRSPAVQKLTDAELASSIANGKPGGLSATAHKSKALAPKQIDDVVAYLRSIRG